VVCHAGYDWRRYGYFRKDWQADSIAFWRDFGKRLSAAGTRLVLENVYEADPEDVLPLAEALSPEGIRWCLDIGHLHAFGNGRLGRWLDALAPHIGQIHLHDNDLADDDHLALGAGGIDMDHVMAYLRHREGDRPMLTLEPHCEADLERSLDFLVKHWPWSVPGLSG
jgi:sugar phosphate isomerase/epimerase